MSIQDFHSLLHNLNRSTSPHHGSDDASARRESGIRSVGIVGAGVMGTAIAAAHALHGLRVCVCDTNEAALDRVHTTVESIFARGQASAEICSQVRRWIQPTRDLASLSQCDLIVESIAETPTAKRQLYTQLKPHLNGRTIVASNTSTIPIAQLATAFDHPSRFCGLHFFHPVARRPLVEVICGPQSSEDTIAAMVAHVQSIQRRPIVAEDGPGFIVNRLLFPYLAEGLEMLREGVAIETIERAAVDFGMAMGPLQLIDEIGLDTTLQAGWVLATAFPERILASPLLVAMVKAKQLGCKSGAGFFLYDQGDRSDEGCSEAGHHAASRPVNPALAKRIEQWAVNSPTPCPSLTDRLLLPMVAEGARILKEGRTFGPAEIDCGAVLGLGFPASRGGLLRWADTLGAAEIVARLRAIDGGSIRFQPPALLADLAKTNGKFYAD